MKRTTVKVSDELDARMRNEARRRGITVSALVNEAIEAHLAGNGTTPARRELSFIGSASVGGYDASRLDELLAELGFAQDATGREPGPSRR